MKAHIKISSENLKIAQVDLHRPHGFAYERVGFITAGCAWLETGDLLLISRTYLPIADEDYIRDRSAGAVIGSDALRKGLQFAYKERSALLHIHTHGGLGVPSFSGIDINSAHEFVPSFFNAIPYMPHGLIVLSQDSAHGLLWFDPKEKPIEIGNFADVGIPYRKIGEENERLA